MIPLRPGRPCPGSSRPEDSRSVVRYISPIPPSPSLASTREGPITRPIIGESSTWLWPVSARPGSLPSFGEVSLKPLRGEGGRDLAVVRGASGERRRARRRRSGSDLIRTEGSAGVRGIRAGDQIILGLGLTTRGARAASLDSSGVAADPIGDNYVVTGDRSTGQRQRLSVRRFSSAAEADLHDLEFWMQIPEDERPLQVWRLSLEQWQLAGHPPHEPRLHRSVTSVRRR